MPSDSVSSEVLLLDEFLDTNVAELDWVVVTGEAEVAIRPETTRESIRRVHEVGVVGQVGVEDRCAVEFDRDPRALYLHLLKVPLPGRA